MLQNSLKILDEKSIDNKIHKTVEKIKTLLGFLFSSCFALFGSYGLKIALNSPTIYLIEKIAASSFYSLFIIVSFLIFYSVWNRESKSSNYY